MAIHLTNDFVFEVPAAYEDQTLHDLDVPLRDDGLLTVLIQRAPLPPDIGLTQLVEAHVRSEGRRLPLHQVLEVKERSVAGVRGIEVTSVWRHGRRQILGREVHVAHRGKHLTFSATTVAPHHEARDAYFDRMMATLELDSGEDLS